MEDTIRLSECYSAASGIEVKDDDSYYSKIELIATGALSSGAAEVPGFQLRIYNAWRNSWDAGEFAKYPNDLCMRISSLSPDHSTNVMACRDKLKPVVNVAGLIRLVEKLDQTTSKDFKIFAGFDERRWDFIAAMDAKKTFLYIKESVALEKIMDYLHPFFKVEMARYVIASEIENRYKARKR
ncbi:MAG: hypothetical protein QME12_06510 [Nanoarchaeota archaeon]|nr:hypothetical protein [Nanoarchaeota archaeon]